MKPLVKPRALHLECSEMVLDLPSVYSTSTYLDMDGGKPSWMAPSARTKSVGVSRRVALTLAAATAPWPAAVPAAAEQRLMPASRRCLVAGATGRTGLQVIEALERMSDIEALAGVRSSSSGRRLPKNIPTIEFDLTSDDPHFLSSLSETLIDKGVTDCICTIGFSPTFIPEEDRKLAMAIDYVGTLKLISAAVAAKLPGRFVLVSSLGVNASSSSARMLDSSLGNVLVQKRAAEAALRASSLDWCIVRPGLLLKDALQGGVLLGDADRFTGDAERDRAGLPIGDGSRSTGTSLALAAAPPVKCSSPFLASSGAVCAATRAQVAAVCVEALEGDATLFSRRIVEVVTRPEVEIGALPAGAGGGDGASPQRRGRLLYRVVPPAPPAASGLM